MESVAATDDAKEADAEVVAVDAGKVEGETESTEESKD